MASNAENVSIWWRRHGVLSLNQNEMATYIWVNIGTGYGFLPDGTKQYWLTISQGPIR